MLEFKARPELCACAASDGGNGMLEPACSGSGEPVGTVSSHCHIQRHHVGSLKMATAGVFTPGEWANTEIGWGLVWSHSWVVIIYQHLTPWEV